MINERLKEFRKAEKKTQKEFADIILMSVDAVSMMERGVLPIAPRTIETICIKFPTLSREWLETGEGEMYLLPLDDETALFEELSRTSTASAQAIRMAIKYYFHLDAEGRKIIDGLVESLLGQ